MGENDQDLSAFYSNKCKMILVKIISASFSNFSNFQNNPTPFSPEPAPKHHEYAIKHVKNDFGMGRAQICAGLMEPASCPEVVGMCQPRQSNTEGERNWG